MIAHSINQGFSTRGIFVSSHPHPPNIYIKEDIQQYLETFYVVITRVQVPLASNRMFVSNAAKHTTMHRTAYNKESFSRMSMVLKFRNLAKLLTQCMKYFVLGTGRCKINLRQNYKTVSCLFLSSFRFIRVTSSHKYPVIIVLNIFFHNNPKSNIFYLYGLFSQDSFPQFYRQLESLTL